MLIAVALEPEARARAATGEPHLELVLDEPSAMLTAASAV